MVTSRAPLGLVAHRVTEQREHMDRHSQTARWSLEMSGTHPLFSLYVPPSHGGQLGGEQKMPLRQTIHSNSMNGHYQSSTRRRAS